MLLSDLRTALREMIWSHVDPAIPTAETTRLTRLVNLAMQHVGNWLISLDADYLLYEWSGTLSNSGGTTLIVVPSLAAATYPKVRKIVAAERTGLATEGPDLDITDLRSVKNKRPTTVQEKPAVFRYNEGIAFLRPKDGIGVKVTWAVGLPNMTHDTNSPGQTGSGDTGTANLLPESFQILIPTYAAYLSVASQNSPDTAKWRDIFLEQRASLLETIRPAKKTPERG